MPLLLILILVGDPKGEALGKGLADELLRIGGERVQVVVGAEAAKQLDAKGLKPADLRAAGNLGGHLTASEKNLAVLTLDRREVSGDIVVECRLWIDGRADQHVAIAGAINGKPVDALPGVLSGVLRLLGGRLPGGGGGAAVAGEIDDARLAVFAERSQWTELLGLLAGVKERSPRQCYYQVLAYAKLGQRDPAVASLNVMRAAHPKHFLLAAAEELVAPAPAKPDPPGAGGDTLRDTPAVKDDGGNTLK